MGTQQVLLCRRLEAGTINTGLSQLQVICNELRKKGKLSHTVGNGLRRVLHPFIDTKTFLSVLFTLSPSVHIEKQEQVIDDNNRQIENIMRMQNKLKFECEQKKKNPNGVGGDDDEKLQDGIQKMTRTIKVINDDGDEEEDVEDYYVDVDGKEVQKPLTP